MELTVLTKVESDKLENLEKTIQRNLTSFYEIGMALMTIRDNRLYRAEYSTFEEYCRGRWSFSKSHANRFIESSKVVENVTPVGVIPSSERQTRPLARLEPEKQREVWVEAVETAPDGKVTAKHVTEVVEKTIHKEKTTTKEVYSSGLIFVEYAISQMERIHPKDTQRKAAWARMRSWLNDNE